ncbi:MAG TPA: phage tail tape measure protein, partial [bacterium]|nr:phage tail tape measure protein [bacterium]
MAIDKQVNVIISSVDRYSSGLSSFRGSMKMVLGGIIAIEAALLAVSIGLAKFTVSMATTAVKSAIDFHDAILNVAAVAQSFGTTTEEIDKILTDLTIKFPLTGKAAGDAMQLIAQMGYGGAEQLEKMADAALTVQIATGADLQTVISAMVGTMNAFEMSIDQVDRVANLFVATANTSAADIPKLAEAMKRAAAVGNTFGISLEQVTALMAMLIQRGTEATTASTMFRQAIASLYKETDNGREALTKYGLTYKDLQGASSDLTKLIGLFEGQVLKGEDAIAIFGVRQVNLTGIINAGADAFSKYEARITGTTAAGDTMKVKMGSWKVVSEQIEGSMDKLKDTIGRDLLKAVIDLIGIDAESGIRGIVGQLIKLEEKYGFIGGPLLQAFSDLKDIAKDVFKEAFGDAQGLYQWLSNLSVVLSKNVEIIGIYAAAFIKAFVRSTGDTEKLVSLMKILNVAWGAISFVIAVVHDLFVGFVYAWELSFAHMGMVWDIIHIAILKGVGNIYKALDLLPTKKFDFTKEIAANELKVAELTKNITTIFDVEPPKLWTGEVLKGMAKSGAAIDKMKFKQVEVAEEAGLTVKKISELGDEWEVVDGKVIKATGSVEELNLTEEEAKRLAKVLKEEYVKVSTEIKKVVDTTQEVEVATMGIRASAEKWKISISEAAKLMNLTDDNVKSILDNYYL